MNEAQVTEPSHQAIDRTSSAPTQPATPTSGSESVSRTLAQKSASTISASWWTSTSASSSSRSRTASMMRLYERKIEPAAELAITAESASRTRSRPGPAAYPYTYWSVMEQPNAITTSALGAPRLGREDRRAGTLPCRSAPRTAQDSRHLHDRRPWYRPGLRRADGGAATGPDTDVPRLRGAVAWDAQAYGPRGADGGQRLGNGDVSEAPHVKRGGAAFRPDDDARTRELQVDMPAGRGTRAQPDARTGALHPAPGDRVDLRRLAFQAARRGTAYRGAVDPRQLLVGRQPDVRRRPGDLRRRRGGDRPPRPLRSEVLPSGDRHDRIPREDAQRVAGPGVWTRQLENSRGDARPLACLSEAGAHLAEQRDVVCRCRQRDEHQRGCQRPPRDSTAPELDRDQQHEQRPDIEVARRPRWREDPALYRRERPKGEHPGEERDQPHRHAV